MAEWIEKLKLKIEDKMISYRTVDREMLVLTVYVAGAAIILLVVIFGCLYLGSVE